MMKTFKTSFIALIFILGTGIVSAQEYKIAVANPKEGRLVLKDFNGTLPIEGYNGTEIIITSNSGEFSPPEKAKGLKPIYPAGSDNTGIGLDVQKIENIITIKCLIPFTPDGEYKIKVPESMSLELSSGCERNNDIIIKNMNNEIDINSCHDIKLTDITGPLVLSTISGNIDITYSTVNSSKTSAINSISGDIDITLPVKTATNLEMNVISGTMYSDFDFPETKSDLKKVGGNAINHSLNGGGFKFAISSVSGNIYLRKGN